MSLQLRSFNRECGQINLFQREDYSLYAELQSLKDQKTYQILADNIDGISDEFNLEYIKDKIQLVAFEELSQGRFSLSFALKEESTIQNTKGPGFTFSELENAKYLQFDKTAPSWRTVEKGLNLEGRCTNSTCPAFKQVIWIRKGIGSFNIGEELYGQKCPECLVELSEKVYNLGFWNCEYKIKGTKEVKNKGIKFESDWTKAPRQEFKTFLPAACKWAFLKIDTKTTNLS